MRPKIKAWLRGPTASDYLTTESVHLQYADLKLGERRGSLPLDGCRVAELVRENQIATRWLSSATHAIY